MSVNVDDIKVTKKKPKNNPQDVLTVLFVIAIMALACIACAWIGRNPEIIRNMTGGGSSNEDYETAKFYSRIVAIVIGAISLIIIGIFLRGMFKRRKREALLRAKEEQKRQEIEAAKKRVEAARMNEFVKAGQSEIANRRNSLRHYNLDEFRDDAPDRKRRINYDDYNKFDDIKGNRPGQYYGHEEKQNLWQRIIGFFKKIIRR